MWPEWLYGHKPGDDLAPWQLARLSDLKRLIDEGYRRDDYPALPDDRRVAFVKWMMAHPQWGAQFSETEGIDECIG